MTLWVEDASEDDEEATFTDWLDLKGYTHWHVPQETYTTSWKAKAKARKLGVRKGVPDHWVIVPTAGTRFLVAIEMKRAHGGTTSDEQFEKIHELNKCRGITALVAHGAGEAIAIITLIQKNEWEEIDEIKAEFEKKYQKRQKTIEKREKAKKVNPF